MTDRRFRVHPAVIDLDLTEAVAYYTDVDAALPPRLAEDFNSTLRRIEANPLAPGEYMPGWRRVLLRVFPYLVAYSVDEHDVHVVGMFHTRRDPDLIKRTLGDRVDR